MKYLCAENINKEVEDHKWLMNYDGISKGVELSVLLILTRFSYDCGIIFFYVIDGDESLMKMKLHHFYFYTEMIQKDPMFCYQC